MYAVNNNRNIDSMYYSFFIKNKLATFTVLENHFIFNRVLSSDFDLILQEEENLQPIWNSNLFNPYSQFIFSLSSSYYTDNCLCAQSDLYLGIVETRQDFNVAQSFFFSNTSFYTVYLCCVCGVLICLILNILKKEIGVASRCNIRQKILRRDAIGSSKHVHKF